MPKRKPPGGPSAHADTFAAEHLPPKALWPTIDFSGLAELRAYPDRMNVADVLLDDHVRAGRGARAAIHFQRRTWSYAQLQDRADRVAHVLVEELGLVPGNRVLLRAPNNPMMAACWYGVLKAGGICVATMPLLRARELSYIIDKAQVSHALCDVRLGEELEEAKAAASGLDHIAYFTPTGDGGQGSDRGQGGGDADLDRRVAAARTDTVAVDTAADDIALIAFTSGTTGQPKGTVHFHRDVLAMCDCFPKHIFKGGADDVYTGSPPLAFTFGLGAMLCFPMRFGASTAMVERPAPETLLETIRDYRCTTLYTAPTAYRAMTELVGGHDLSSLRKCVSAGEHLPLPTFEAWREATGIEIIDGLGSTEMLHIFVSASGADIRPGATGKAIPGYQACILDDTGEPVPPGTIGNLAVRGPTGCRYLEDAERQRVYVRNGWNLPGDTYRMDEDGYFWYQARTDDMIISAGYNISGPEVEAVLLDHPKVSDCAVVASPDPDRGHVAKAFVILRDPAGAGGDTAKELQDFVKEEIAPYKYPRAVEFVEDLPRTQTGKIQRFKLRRLEEERARGGG